MEGIRRIFQEESQIFELSPEAVRARLEEFSELMAGGGYDEFVERLSPSASDSGFRCTCYELKAWMHTLQGREDVARLYWDSLSVELAEATDVLTNERDAALNRAKGALAAARAGRADASRQILDGIPEAHASTPLPEGCHPRRTCRCGGRGGRSPAAPRGPYGSHRSASEYTAGMGAHPKPSRHPGNDRRVERRPSQGQDRLRRLHPRQLRDGCTGIGGGAHHGSFGEPGLQRRCGRGDRDQSGAHVRGHRRRAEIRLRSNRELGFAGPGRRSHVVVPQVFHLLPLRRGGRRGPVRVRAVPRFRD